MALKSTENLLTQASNSPYPILPFATSWSENMSFQAYRRFQKTPGKNSTDFSESISPGCSLPQRITSLTNVHYKGEISPEAENVINRDFHAEKPNEKWITDITEFSIHAGKVYLSPFIDCFDGMPVSWTIGTSPDAMLVNTMPDDAISILTEDEKPLVHSDRGCHYRWPGWIERMEKAGLTRSMSRKGCSPGNSACEGFFGRLKNGMFYGHSWTGISICPPPLSALNRNLLLQITIFQNFSELISPDNECCVSTDVSKPHNNIRGSTE